MQSMSAFIHCKPRKNIFSLKLIYYFIWFHYLFYLRLLLLLLERIFPSGPRSVAAIVKVIINDRYLHVLRLHGAPTAPRSSTASVSSVGALLLLPPLLPPPPRVAHTAPAWHRRKTARRAGSSPGAQVEDHLLLRLLLLFLGCYFGCEERRRCCRRRGSSMARLIRYPRSPREGGVKRVLAESAADRSGGVRWGGRQARCGRLTRR